MKMRIELRDEFRTMVGEVKIDPAQQPSRARLTDQDREVFLNWDNALDDASQLRRCLSCGCRDMFREKAFPPIVGVIVVFNYAGLIVGIFGGAENLFVRMGMIILLVTGLVVLRLSRTRLVCYHCRTSFYDLSIAQYHRSWDRSIADRHPARHPPEPKPSIDESFEIEDYGDESDASPGQIKAKESVV
ncbi:MAG: hypothetical protein O7G85_10415 [Planctomycetota bacterium]|nr:hypothetical protein [Planctomycetota bacterium]